MVELKPVGFIAPCTIVNGASLSLGVELPFTGRLVGLRMCEAAGLVLSRVTLMERDLLPCAIPVHTFAGLLAEQLRPFIGPHVLLGQGLVVTLHFRNDGGSSGRPQGALLVEAAL